MSLHQQSATETVNQLKTGMLQPIDVVNHLQARINKHNPVLNAIIAQEKNMTIGTDGILAGLPITLKDHIHYTGLPCTFGSKIYEKFVPDRNASIVDQLLKNGATILGKTNLPPFAMDFQCNNDLFGTTENPWHSGYTPGGSSGAGCASVAAGLSFIDIGTDLAGSLRIPASFCGVFSLLPSEDALPGDGMMVEGAPELNYFARSGPIARSADDLFLGWQALTSNSEKLPECDPEKLHIEWIFESEGIPVCSRILDRIETTLETWRASHVQISSNKPEGFSLKQARKTFGEIMGFETGALIPAPARLLARLFGRAAANRSPEFIRNVMKGYRRNKQNFQLALKEKDRLTKTIEDHLGDNHFLLLPVTATSAFKHMSPTSERRGNRDYAVPLMINSQKVNYFDALTAFTTPIGCTGLPVLTIPMGLDAKGFPVGAQLVGRKGCELSLLGAAKTLSALHTIADCPMLHQD